MEEASIFWSNQSLDGRLTPLSEYDVLHHSLGVIACSCETKPRNTTVPLRCGSRSVISDPQSWSAYFLERRACQRKQLVAVFRPEKSPDLATVCCIQQAPLNRRGLHADL